VAGRHEVVTVSGSQRQEPVPHPPFDFGSRHLVGEAEVAEPPSWLEAGIDEGTVHSHDLERADDLVPRAQPGSQVARNGCQGEQVVLGPSLGAGKKVTA
jgi:hypothetical protein